MIEESCLICPRPLVSVACFVAGKAMVHRLDLGARAGPAAAAGAITLLDHLSAGVDSADEAAHDDDNDDDDGGGVRGESWFRMWLARRGQNSGGRASCGLFNYVHTDEQV